MIPELVFVWAQNLAALAWVAVLLVSFLGLGSLVIRSVAAPPNPPAALLAAVGISAYLSVAGVLTLVHGFNRGTILAVLAVGAAFGMQVSIRQFADIRYSFKLLSGGKAWSRFITVAICCRIAFQLCSYATAPSYLFHPADDLQFYIPQVQKTLALGTIPDEPFSERRFTSQGGQSVLIASVACFFDPPHWKLMDSGLCAALLAILIVECCQRLNANRKLALLLATGAAFLPPETGNLTAAASSTLLFGSAIYLLLESPGERFRLVTFAWLISGLLLLKSTNLPFAAGLILLAGSRWARDSAPILPGALRAAAVVTFALFPYMLQMLRSSGTLFYPLTGRGFHGSAWGTSYLADWTWDRAAHEFLRSFEYPIFWTTALMVAAGTILLRPRASRRPLYILGLGVAGIFFLEIETQSSLQTNKYALPYLWPAALLCFAVLPSAMKHFGGERIQAIVAFALLLPLGIRRGSSELRTASALLKANTFDLSFRVIVPAALEPSLARAQAVVPPGATILLHSSACAGLDFRRNNILICDLPFGSSPPPGMRETAPAEVLRHYFLEQRIEYVIFSHHDGAGFRANRGDGPGPSETHRRWALEEPWVLRQNQLALSFQERIWHWSDGHTLFRDDNTMLLRLTTGTPPAQRQ